MYQRCMTHKCLLCISDLRIDEHLYYVIQHLYYVMQHLYCVIHHGRIQNASLLFCLTVVFY